MSLSLVATSTLPSSSFSNPLHYCKPRNLSTINLSKTISYTSCEQKQNKDADSHTIDRRNVLLGIGGGLYGASALGTAIAAPTPSEIPKAAAETVSKKKGTLVDSVKNFFGMKKEQVVTEPAVPVPETVPAVVVEPPKIKKEYAQVSADLEVDLPASEIWAVYSSPDLPSLIVELLPQRFEKIDILQGNGGEGTVLHCVLKSGNSGPLEWNEKIVKIDDKTRTKVVRQVEGGYLDIGFCHYEHIFTITEKDSNSCTVRMTASFGVDEKFESNAKMITPNWGMAKAIAKYVVESKAKKSSET